MSDTAAKPEATTTKPWLSRTLFTSIIAIVLPAAWPAAAAWIAANPAAYSALLGGAFAGLRVITKGRLSIVD